jgi:hypothetical protein
MTLTIKPLTETERITKNTPIDLPRSRHVQIANGVIHVVYDVFAGLFGTVYVFVILAPIVFAGVVPELVFERLLGGRAHSALVFLENIVALLP